MHGGAPSPVKKTAGDVAQVILWTLDYETIYHENLRMLMERFVYPVSQTKKGRK